MHMWKSKARERIPSIPANLIWERLIAGLSQKSLQECVDEIEKMQTFWYLRWFILRPISVYPLGVDADTAEFVITMKISNGVNAWLFAGLHAETPTSTSIEAEVGFDGNGILLFALFIFVNGVVIMFMTQNFLSLVIGLLFFGFFWVELRWAFERRLVNGFKRAVGLDDSN